MSADTITITAGRQARDDNAEDFSGEDGTYTVILSSVSEVIDEPSRQPRTLRNGKPDPKDDGRWVYRTWVFAIEDEGPNEGQVLEKRINARATGPKSGQAEAIAALLGHTPQAGEQFTVSDLPGHSCLALVLTKEGTDFPYIKSLMPLPGRRAAAAAAAPIGRGFATPAAVAPTPEAVETAPGSNAMPF